MIYNDPLHIPYTSMTVYYDGQAIYMMNKQLLDQQNAWHNLDLIIETHWLKLVIYDMMLDTEDPKLLKSLAKDLTEIEYELQKLWGFPLDANYHKFWEYPKCECPVMDNEDRYPHSRIMNLNCPLHGDLIVTTTVRLEAD